ARREAEARRAAAEANAKLAAIVEHSDDAILSKSLDGIITSWNSSAERLFGYTADEAIGKPITLLIPEDRLHEEDMIIGAVREGRRTQHFETLRRRKDGTLVNVSLSVSPVRNEHGEVIGASKIARNISERVEAQERQALLMREMNHRIKNLFALTGGLISLSARAADSVEELEENLRERVAALARAHALTMPEGVEQPAGATNLIELLRAILSPYEADQGHVVEIEGDDIPVHGSGLTSLALVFHEFATNAAKYGALSAADGRLSIKLERQGETLLLKWIERGGPTVTGSPDHAGFGSKLEKATLSGLGAVVEKVWKPEGLVLTVALPTERLAAG
ncbi:MAG: PAS domain S-box protein, partial [Hyphomicrobium denitrificans]|nr:PAS domain S-box protein [Hyphomicrobium denitrificans]